MVSEQFKEIVKEIQDQEKEFEITPRELLSAFGCAKRTSGNLARIDRFLEENQLKTIPDYTDGWIDGCIVLKHKQKAKSKKRNDPIQRIKLLPAANREPVSISQEAILKEAVTLMMLNNYSQLPVMSGKRTVVGAITWETIGHGITNGSKSDKVKDYLKDEITLIDYEAPILGAVSKIIDNDFALIIKKDKTISGIVTIADISLQFINVTEPFLLLEQIENNIRQILDGKFLIADLRGFCKTGDTDRKIDFIDDLNFGDYVRIIENPDYWDKLELSIERKYFIKQLDKIREIRNDIMHFDPEGITFEQRIDLVKMSNFLMEIRKFI